MINIALVEDCAELARAEQHYIEANWKPGETLGISHFCTGEAFLESETDEYDILIADVQLPGIDGIELVRQLRGRGSKIFVVFLTSYDEYAVHSYRLEVEQYVLKNDMEERLARIIDVLRERIIQGRNRFVILQDGEDTRKISFNDILYFKKEGKYVVYVTADKELRERKVLEKAYQESGGGFPFIKIERGFVANMWHVETLSEDTVIMDNGHRLPVSRRLLPSVKSGLGRCGMKP